MNLQTQLETLSEGQLKNLANEIIPAILSEREQARRAGAGLLRIDLVQVIEQALSQVDNATGLREWLTANQGREVLIEIDSAAVGSPIMTAGEAAQLLKVSERTVTSLLKAGTIPGEKVGRAWRIKRQAVMRYLAGLADE